MRSYEAVFIFRPEENLVTEGKTFVKAEMEKAGFSIKNETDMGERQLAYEIQKQPRGHYYLFEVECEPDQASSLDGTFKLRPEILKFLFTRT